MINFKSIFTLAMAALFSATAFAQECGSNGCPAKEEAENLGYWTHPYGFVQVQGGAGVTFTRDVNFTELITPTYSVGVGAMFTPAVGARIHVNGYESTGKMPSIDTKYKYKYINSNVDVLLNITNLCRKTYKKVVDVYLVGGVGLNYAWDNSEFTGLVQNRRADITEDVSNAWGDNTTRKGLLGHNFRAGVLLDFNLCKNLSLGIEADINSLSDRFNSKYTSNDDWMLTAQASLTYKFGHKKCVKPAPVPEPEPVVVPPVVVPVPEPVAEVVVKEEPIKEVIYYEIRGSEPVENILNNVVEWCNKYPEKNITIDGYADAGTGNPTINAKYAEERATKVADALKAKGIAADRMIVKSYGDTVQPFAENDKNRCVIIVGK